MLVNQQVIIVAGIAGIAAIVVPMMAGDIPNTAPREPANITRADKNDPPLDSSLFSPRKKRTAKKKRLPKHCDTNGDFKIANCGKSRSARVKAGRIVKSKGGRSITVAQDTQGHFRVTTRMNGRRIPVLVDTGATSVAINMRTARRLGIDLTQADFKYDASTANGKTKYARAKIREIRIGGIVVDNVDAAVLSDQALGSTLLGMSFLKKLSKYSVENGELKMTQ